MLGNYRADLRKCLIIHIKFFCFTRTLKIVGVDSRACRVTGTPQVTLLLNTSSFLIPALS